MSPGSSAFANVGPNTAMDSAISTAARPAATAPANAAHLRDMTVKVLFFLSAVVWHAVTDCVLPGRDLRDMPAPNATPVRGAPQIQSAVRDVRPDTSPPTIRTWPASRPGPIHDDSPAGLYEVQECSTGLKR